MIPPFFYYASKEDGDKEKKHLSMSMEWKNVHEEVNNTSKNMKRILNERRWCIQRLKRKQKTDKEATIQRGIDVLGFPHKEEAKE